MDASHSRPARNAEIKECARCHRLASHAADAALCVSCSAKLEKASDSDMTKVMDDTDLSK